MISRARQAFHLVRSMGPSWIAFRILYAMRARTGKLRRAMPRGEWAEHPLHRSLRVPELQDPEALLAHRRLHAPAFFFAPRDWNCHRSLLGQWDTPAGESSLRASEVTEGKFSIFGGDAIDTGLPPAWNRNPLTGETLPADLHWSQIDEFAHGDIKPVWELNRFGFAYVLVRAFWRTGDETLAELFWTLLEDWKQQNPPNVGPNWKCGQEATLRLMAWCFGLYGFLEARSTTASRVASLVQMIAVTGERIERNFGYAKSQRNNHGISEAAGLWTIGTLFPEFRRSSSWRAMGEAALESHARELIQDDGAFSQQSVNYHRLMLHDYLWVMRLAELNGGTFDTVVRDRVRAATEWLYQLQDPVTGSVPNYGENDGALILPLNNCGQSDFRPVIQALFYLLERQRILEAGPWDEDLFWMFGPEAVDSASSGVPRSDRPANESGYYTLRSPRSFVFTRCPKYRTRPGQADALHVDVWWKGENIAIDAGTFSYNARPPWDKGLALTEYHNTVTVDGVDQMNRAGRFLWLPWLQGTLHTVQRSDQGTIAYWEGAHDGYHRLESPATHTRAIVRLGDEHWLVLDRLESKEKHRYRLHWLLSDYRYSRIDPSTVLLHTQAGPFCVSAGTDSSQFQTSLARADTSGTRGWRAPSYARLEPALSLDMTVESASASFWTLLGPPPHRVVRSGPQIDIFTDGSHSSITLTEASAPTLVKAIRLSGRADDQLELTSCTYY